MADEITNQAPQDAAAELSEQQLGEIAAQPAIDEAVPQDAAQALSLPESHPLEGMRRGLAGALEPSQDLEATGLQKVGIQNLIDMGALTKDNVEQASVSEAERSYAKRLLGVKNPQAEAEAKKIVDNMNLMQGLPEEISGQAPAPVGTDTVLAPQLSAEEQQSLAEAEALAAEAEKRQAEEEARRLAAEEAAKVEAKDSAAAVEVQKEKDAEKKTASDDAAARQAVVSEDDEEGFNLRQTIAILIGGLSQGLTGAADNPALVMLDKIRDRKDKKRKELIEQQRLTEEQKLAREKADLDRLKFHLDAFSKKINNTKTLAEIKQINAQLEKEAEELRRKQMLRNRPQGSGLSVEELSTLVPDDDKGFYVRNPFDEKFYRVLNKTSAKQLNEQIGDLTTATEDLKKLQGLVTEFGNNPISKLLDRENIARAQTLQQAVIGNLRIALFGPGVITDNERAIAEGIIRNPAKFFSLASANKAALDQIMSKVNTGIRQKLRQNGADIPLNSNERKINILMRKFPNKFKTKGEAANALIKANQWDATK